MSTATIATRPGRYDGAAIVGGSVYLRQRRSAQSKPVHAPHAETGD
ncbi:DUF6766 family protein [Kribbella sp. NPDC026596]